MSGTARRFVLAFGVLSQVAMLGLNWESLSLLPLQLLFSIWVLAPFGLYWLLTESRGTPPQTALSGAMLLAMHAYFLQVYLGSKSSTSAVMFLVTPVYELLPLALLFLPPGRAPLGLVLAFTAMGLGAIGLLDQRTKEAADPATSPARLETIAAGGWGRLRRVKGALAANPSAPAALLGELTEGGEAEVLRDVGKNPNATPELLLRIARENKGYTALWGVARNPRTPPAALLSLSRRTAEDAGGRTEWSLYQTYVLSGIAANPSSPLEALENVAPSEELFANLALIDNPRTPCRLLEKPAASGEHNISAPALRALRQRCGK